MPATTQAVFAEMVVETDVDTAVSTNKFDDGIAFFHSTHQKYAVFATEPGEVDAPAARFGAKNVTYTIPKNCDLLWAMFARVTVPGLVGVYKERDAATGEEKVKVLKGAAAPYWHNAIGQRVLASTVLAFGGTATMDFDDTYMFLYESISGRPGKRLGEASGKFEGTPEEQRTKLQAWSKRAHTMYVPLPFPFTESPANALAVAALWHHRIEVQITMAPRDKCYILPAGAPTGTQVCVRPDGAKDSEIEARKVTPELLADSHLQVHLDTIQVFTEEEERNRMLDFTFEQCITEVQGFAHPHTYTGRLTASAVKAKVPLPFVNVVKQLFFVVRQQAKEEAGNHYDFGGHVDGDVEDGGSGLTLGPVKSWCMKYGNTVRVAPHDGDYLLHVPTWLGCSNAEAARKQFIYVMNPSVEPEAIQPSGGIHLAKLESPSLELELDPHIFTAENPTVDILVYARCMNIWRYHKGTLLRKHA